MKGCAPGAWQCTQNAKLAAAGLLQGVTQSSVSGVVKVVSAGAAHGWSSTQALPPFGPSTSA